jgi:putative ABC transport system permease protein
MGGARLWAASVVRRRLTATVLLAVLAGLAGGVVLTTVGVARRTSSALDRYLDQPNLTTSLVIACPKGMTEEGVQGDPGTVCGTTDNVLAVAREVVRSPLVGSVVPMATLVTGLRSTAGQPWFPTIQYAALDGWQGLPNAPVVVAGRLPASGAADEAAMNERLARELGLTVGDSFEMGNYLADQRGDAVTQGEDSVPAGPRSELHLTGIIRAVDDVAPDPERIVVTTAGWWRANGSDDLAGYGKGVAVHLVDRRNEPQLDASLRAAMPDRLFDVSSYQASTEATRRVIELQAGAAWAVALVALVAVVGFVGQALGREAARDLSDRATLITLGMTRRGMVAGSALRMLPSAIGAALIAGVATVLASPVGPVGLGRRIEIHPGIRADMTVLAVGSMCIVGVVVAIPTMAAVFTLRRGSRQPQPRFRSLPVGTPTSVRAGLSFLGRSDQSAVVGAVVGTAVAVAVVVSAIAVSSSYTSLLAAPERFGQTWDVVLGDFGSPEETADGRAAIAGVDGIDDINTTRSTEASIGDDPVFVVSFLEPTGVVGPEVLEGRAPTTATEIAVGTSTMADEHLALGDEVTLRSPVDGSLVGPLRVVGRVVPNDGVDTAQSPGRGVVVTDELFDRIDVNTTGQSLLIAASDGVGADTLVERLRAAFGGSVAPARAPEDVVNLERVSTVPALLAALVGLLALSALVNALLNVLGRRRRDIAILRSLGFARSQVLGSALTVATAVSAAAVVLGVPLGLVVARWAWGLLETRLGVRSGVVVPVGWVLVVAVVTVVVAEVVSLIPGLRAARIRAAEALRSE